MSDLVFFRGRRLGRPPRAGVRARRGLRLFVTDAEHNALRDVATEEGRKLSEVIRDAVNEYVADFQEKVVFTPSGDRFPHQKDS